MGHDIAQAEDMKQQVKLLQNENNRLVKLTKAQEIL